MTLKEKLESKVKHGKVDKRLNQYSGVILNQKKHDEVNDILEKMDLPGYPIVKR
jgi:hypothetical protein